ncbi:hypothetical protein CTI12_AA466760 [Artemisia annua]|uniref:Uncharacterized protein n=1 Tax=Artemisia annua TaxID=35608 RepID=A0A2U1LQB8_ARTAN|nr:hypothetical protein CTI12_AA466760 [Artemisia annua]
MKGVANPMIKAVKHRIKSRKTRLMVDIYKTAPHCTVEELDKRNGTSWATNSNFPDQELEFQAEHIKEKSAFIHEVAGNEGDVYIDTNGKKVRILSMPNLNTLDDSEGRKLKKRRKCSKFIMEKKKNGQKSSTLTPNKRKFSKKDIRGEEENVAIKEICKKKDVTITRPPWACSKRTGLAKKRFPVLTKPNEDIHLDDSCEDSSSNTLKERNFSSLNKELLLERREQNAGSKLNLKRKFSALKKSRDHRLSTEDSVIEPSNDSLKEKSRMKEGKKKQSMTSKSSNEDSSSRGIEITSESGKTDQVQLLSDHVGIEGRFMSLSNSFNDEYYDTFDSGDDIIKNIMIGHNTEDCMTNIDEQKNYFEDMDLIPIPGPPGSFLPPSPGADTVYEEELQGNSSLTNTSKVQSSDQDHRHDDLMNADVISDSPMSNVSNPSFARSSDILPAQFTSDLRPVGAVFTEKGLNPSDKIGQPCCCSKKVGLYHQESREQALESCGMNLIKPLADASIKLLVQKDCESAISPTSVIRLMGKNLTVVRTDDNPPACSSHMSHQQCRTGFAPTLVLELFKSN